MIKYFVLLLFVSGYGCINVTSDCGEKEKAVLFLDVAVEMIDKAKSSINSYLDIERNVTKIVVIGDNPADCADILQMGQRKSGVYKIRPNNRLTEEKQLDVYCDMDTDGGGWTVIQRRGSYGNAEDYFFKEWKSYKKGFGNIEKEFWFGNDNIFALTNQKLYSARFDLQDWVSNKAYALYPHFWIDDEFNNYTLHIKGFSGDAGDSLIKHNNHKFSTKDVDNDADKFGDCAISSKGAWWYYECDQSNLNGLNNGYESTRTGIHWYTWKGHTHLKSTEIKIRPKNFVVSNDITKTPQ